MQANGSARFGQIGVKVVPDADNEQVRATSQVISTLPSHVISGPCQDLPTSGNYVCGRTEL